MKIVDNLTITNSEFLYNYVGNSGGAIQLD